MRRTTSDAKWISNALTRIIALLISTVFIVSTRLFLLDAQAKTLTIVAFGDSTTAPRAGVVVYAKLLERLLLANNVEARIINAGVGGDTTDSGKTRFQRDVLNHQPDLVVLQFGINDSSVNVWETPPASTPTVAIDNYKDNLIGFIRTLKQNGTEIILMTPNPLRWTDNLKKAYGKLPYDPEDPDGFNVLLKRYGSVVRLVANQERIPLIDVYQAFETYGAGKNRSINDLLLDGMHPNSAGHRIVASLLTNQIISRFGSTKK